MAIIVKCLLFSIAVLIGGVSDASKINYKYDYLPKISLSYQYNNYNNLGMVDLFMPLKYDNNNLLFADLRGWMDNNGIEEGNFGLGFRHMNSNDIIIGGYSFFDKRRTKNNHMFTQYNFGFEVLTLNWDFRTNFYFSDDRKKYLDHSNGSFVLSGSSVYFHEPYYESSLKGYDVEIGRRIPYFENLELFVKYYHFWNNKIHETLDGFGFRGKYYLLENNNYDLSVKLFYNSDDLRGDTKSLGLQYRHTFGKKNNIPKDSRSIRGRMTDEIIRDVDIITKESAGDIYLVSDSGNLINEANDIIDEENYLTILYVDNSVELNGDGTLLSPFTTLKEAENASAENDVIYVYSGDGTHNGYDEGLDLKDGQKLIGQGSNLTLADISGNVSDSSQIIINSGKHSFISKSFSGGDDNLNNYLNNIDNYGVVVAANDVIIKGVKISSFNTNATNLYNHGSGITVKGKNNVTISNNILTDNVNSGIYAVSANNLTINNNNDISNNYRGLDLYSANNNKVTYNINNNHINNNNNIGVNILSRGNSETDLTIDNNKVTYNINNNNINNNNNIGVNILSRGNSETDLTIDNNIINGSGGNAINVTLSNDSIANTNINSNNINNTAGTSINLQYSDNSSGVSNINDNKIDASTDYAIYLNHFALSNITSNIVGNTVTNGGRDGIYVRSSLNSGNYQISSNISNNTSSNNEETGIKTRFDNNINVSNQIKNNIIDYNKTDGIFVYLTLSNGYIINNDISNNNLNYNGGDNINAGVGQGINILTYTGGSFNNLISDNNIIGSGAHAILLEFFLVGEKVDPNAVSNNVIVNNNTQDNYFGIGLHGGFNTVNLSLSGNNIKNVTTGDSLYVDSNGIDNINIDIGGGNLGSTGGNSLEGKTIINGAIGNNISAKNNWWGESDGASGDQFTGDYSIGDINVDNHLTEDPFQ